MLAAAAEDAGSSALLVRAAASIVWHWLHLRDARMVSIVAPSPSHGVANAFSVHADRGAMSASLVLKIFAPLSPLPIGHSRRFFSRIGSADPQISALLLRAQPSWKRCRCAVRYVCLYTHCVALCCGRAAHERAKERFVKARYGGDKTEPRKEHRRFWPKGRSATAVAMRACNRGIPSPGKRSRGQIPSAPPDASACDARELWRFGWLSLPDPVLHSARVARRGLMRLRLPPFLLGIAVGGALDLWRVRCLVPCP